MRKRILVVDDDKINLLRTKKILERYYDVSLLTLSRLKDSSCSGHS